MVWIKIFGILFVMSITTCVATDIYCFIKRKIKRKK